MDIRKRAICANCKSRYIEGDKYCRYCGAPNGSPEYIQETFASIYGPPYRSAHKCKECGFSWENSGLGSDRQKWCPKCGGKAPVEDLDRSKNRFPW